MPLEEESLIGAAPELGTAVNTQGIVTLGIYALGAYVAYRVLTALAKKTGIA